MKSTEENFGKTLLKSAVDHAPKSKFERFKRVDRKRTILTLGLGVVAMLATGEFKIVFTILVLLSSVLSMVKSKITTSEQSTKPTKEDPPRYLLLVAAFILPSDSRDAALGDMEEKYNKAFTRFGRKWAIRLMARDILCSIFSTLIHLTRKMLVAALKVIGIYEIYRRFKG